MMEDKRQENRRQTRHQVERRRILGWEMWWPLRQLDKARRASEDFLASLIGVKGGKPSDCYSCCARHPRSSCCSLDAPQLKFELGPIAGDMETKRRRCGEIAPVWHAAVEFEINKAW